MKQTSLVVLALLGLTQGLKHQGRVQNLLDNLSQTKAQGSETCETAINRLKTPDNWNDVLNNDDAEYTYTDESFATTSAITWVDLGATDSFIASQESSIWMSFNELADHYYDVNSSYYWYDTRDNANTPTLMGADGLQITDIQQGGLGNCYFQAAAAAVAEDQERFMDMWITQTFNK